MVAANEIIGDNNPR